MRNSLAINGKIGELSAAPDSFPVHERQHFVAHGLHYIETIVVCSNNVIDSRKTIRIPFLISPRCHALVWLVEVCNLLLINFVIL